MMGVGSLGRGWGGAQAVRGGLIGQGMSSLVIVSTKSLRVSFGWGQDGDIVGGTCGKNAA